MADIRKTFLGFILSSSPTIPGIGQGFGVERKLEKPWIGLSRLLEEGRRIQEVKKTLYVG